MMWLVFQSRALCRAFSALLYIAVIHNHSIILYSTIVLWGNNIDRGYEWLWVKFNTLSRGLVSDVVVILFVPLPYFIIALIVYVQYYYGGI